MLKLVLTKIFGIVLLILGVFLLFSVSFGLLTSVNNLLLGQGLVSGNSAYSVGTLIGQFIGYVVLGLIDWVLFKFGVKLLFRRKYKMDENDILDAS